MNPIKEFRGEYFFLSNFYNAKIEYFDMIFENNEAAFQSMKCPERMQLSKAMAFIDVNNADHSLLQFLEEQNFITPTGVTMPSGFVVYPLYRLNLEKIEEYTGL